VLVLDMIEILPPLGKYKYDTWRILLVMCYLDNSVRLQSYIRNINTLAFQNLERTSWCQVSFDLEPPGDSWVIPLATQSHPLRLIDLFFAYRCNSSGEIVQSTSFP
jgi:hypothetical protein